MSNQKRFALIGAGIGSPAWNEAVEDTVGALLVDSAEIDFTYTDGTPSIAAALVAASVTFAKLQNADALSVLGRSANSAGVLDEIAFGTDGMVLRRSGTTLGAGLDLPGLMKFTNATTAIELESTSPRILFDDTNAGSNERLTSFTADAATGSLRLLTDAGAAGDSVLSWARTGSTLTAMNFGDNSGAFYLEFNAGSIASSFSGAGPVTFSISQIDANDGSYPALFINTDAGSTYFYVAALPAATSAPLVSGGPSGAHTIVDFGGGPGVFSVNFTARAQIDDSSTASHTSLLLYDVDNGQLERVTVGAADSGGTGFKLLRIPN